jgi:hypothetical protein
MTTYREPVLSLDDEVLAKETLWFFRRHLHNAVYDFLIRTFRRLEDADRMTKGRLSTRIDREPASVTRWLSAPSNLTLNTISDLFVGMAVDPTTLLADEMSVDRVAAEPAKLESALVASMRDQELTKPPQSSRGNVVRLRPAASGQGRSAQIDAPPAEADERASILRLAK